MMNLFKQTLRLACVLCFALAIPFAYAEKDSKAGAKDGKVTECCDQKDCCKDCKHKEGKHSCCDEKKKAEACCKNCKDKKCEKACASGNCKKDHCEKKKGKSGPDDDAT